MTNAIFLHYPPCASNAYERIFDDLVRKHPTLSFFIEKVHISSTVHAIQQMRYIEPLRARTHVGRYPLYAVLFLLTRASRPPSPLRILERRLFCEDLFKIRYHFSQIDLCALGIFVPRSDGKWQYDMWRNARRLFRYGKPVWQITGSRATGWSITILHAPPPRELRLGRKETMDGVGTYAEPKKYPSLFTLIRDLLKTRE